MGVLDVSEQHEWRRRSLDAERPLSNDEHGSHGQDGPPDERLPFILRERSDSLHQNTFHHSFRTRIVDLPTSPRALRPPARRHMLQVSPRLDRHADSMETPRGEVLPRRETLFPENRIFVPIGPPSGLENRSNLPIL